MSRTLKIDKIGAPVDGKVTQGIIYRCSTIPGTTDFPFVIVSDHISSGREIDVITLPNFRQFKERLSKTIRSRLGIELTIASARKQTGPGASRWFAELGEAYAFCQSAGCQLILSSGALSVSEMVSGLCFDAILNEAGVNPQRHWNDMTAWLDETVSKRVRTA